MGTLVNFGSGVWVLCIQQRKLAPYVLATARKHAKASVFSVGLPNGSFLVLAELRDFRLRWNHAMGKSRSFRHSELPSNKRFPSHGCLCMFLHALLYGAANFHDHRQLARKLAMAQKKRLAVVTSVKCRLNSGTWFDCDRQYNRRV